MTNRAEAIASLERNIEEGRPDEIMYFLVEFLAEWGPEGIDVQRLANRVFEREEDEHNED